MLNNSLTIVNFQKRLRDFVGFTVNFTPVKCEKNFLNHPVQVYINSYIYIHAHIVGSVGLFFRAYRCIYLHAQDTGQSFEAVSQRVLKKKLMESGCVVFVGERRGRRQRAARVAAEATEENPLLQVPIRRLSATSASFMAAMTTRGWQKQKIHGEASGHEDANCIGRATLEAG